MLSYETEPLTEDLDVAGPVVAQLFASTSGTDGDWIVKLIDVYPEDADQPLAGYQLMIANEVFRGRFRKSFEQPEPVVSGQVEEYPIDLHWTDHRFKKGHKIMVQIQSTWFPLIDRNPQKFVPNIFEAKATDYRPRASASIALRAGRRISSCRSSRPTSHRYRTKRDSRCSRRATLKGDLYGFTCTSPQSCVSPGLIVHRVAPIVPRKRLE